MVAISIIASLVGYTVAVKLYTLWKMSGLKIDQMSEKEIESLVKQKYMFEELPKQYLKYMR